jgi:hypothetical protein
MNTKTIEDIADCPASTTFSGQRQLEFPVECGGGRERVAVLGGLLLTPRGGSEAVRAGKLTHSMGLSDL